MEKTFAAEFYVNGFQGGRLIDPQNKHVTHEAWGLKSE